MMFLQWSLVLICSSAIVYIFAKYRRKSYNSHSVTCEPDEKALFDQLQRRYLCGFASASFADWLYGPYIYQLYVHYGYDTKIINTLYVTGFFSSMIFGTLIGYLADTYGRKRVCLCHTIIGIFSSLCKLSSSFKILLVGHVLFGINSSILSSVFSVWYMHEHLERYHFPREWLNSTFTTATFLNGVTAILAGAIADLAVHYAWNDPLAPFILIIPVLYISALYILQWDENIGSKTKEPKFFNSLNVFLHLKDTKLLLMGAVQSLTEASIYAFVVVWPPLLHEMPVPQGLVFAMLMASLSLGAAALHSFLKGSVGIQSLLISLHIATVAFGLLTMLHFSNTRPSAMTALIPALFLEFATGMYFPSFGSLLSVIVPEAVRASVSNMYRLPMNLFMCVILVWSHHTGHQELFSLFSVCTMMAVLALCACYLLRCAMNNTQSGTHGRILPEQEQKLVEKADIIV